MKYERFNIDVRVSHLVPRFLLRILLNISKKSGFHEGNLGFHAIYAVNFAASLNFKFGVENVGGLSSIGNALIGFGYTLK